MLKIRARSAALALTFFLPLFGCGAEADDSQRLAVAEDVTAPQDTSTATAPETTPTQSEPTGPVTDLPPNELGQIMVLEYHRIGDNEGEWVRSEVNFRRDLQTLYEKGNRPVLMRDVVRGHIDTPA